MSFLRLLPGPAVLVVSLVLALSANIILSVTSRGGEVAPPVGASTAGNSSTTSSFRNASSEEATLIEMPQISKPVKMGDDDGCHKGTVQPVSRLIPQIDKGIAEHHAPEEAFAAAMPTVGASSVIGPDTIAKESRGKWAKYAVRNAEKQNESASRNEA